MAEQSVSDEEFAKAAEKFPHNTPLTKEAYRYRCIYEKNFPTKVGSDKLIQKWLPWISNKFGGFHVDPSGFRQRAYAEKPATETK